MVNYAKHMWRICCDLKVVAMLCGLQSGYIKYMCFLCDWDTRFSGDQYACHGWKLREHSRLQTANIIREPLVPKEKILLPPLHIKLGIVKNFIKTVAKRDEVFLFLKLIYPRLSESKIKEGVLNGPDIRKLIKSDAFNNILIDAELNAWQEIKEVIEGLLGKHRSNNYDVSVARMLRAFSEIGVHMSLKMHYIHHHLDYFSKQLATESDEQGERYHQVAMPFEMRKTRSANTAISKYFYTALINETEYPVHEDEKQEIEVNVNRKPSPLAKVKCVQELEKDDSLTATDKHNSNDCSYKETLHTKKTRKRTKLKDFVLKKGTNIPVSRENHTDDWKQCFKKQLKEEKKTTNFKRNRRSPMFKTSRCKNSQLDIKSSLMRSERIFSEITAQHCKVDNFSADEVQLALALSKSEVETSGTNEGVAFQQNIKQNEDDNMNDIKNMLQQYGFRTFPEGYKNLTPEFLTCSKQRSKLKWANKFTALTLREPKHQRTKVNLRINSLMSKQLVCKLSGFYKDYFSYSLISKGLHKLKATKDCLRRLDSEDSKNLENFYVQDLFEVTHVQSGYLLKDWHTIQGRNKSPQRDKHSQIKEIESAKQMKRHQTGIIEINNNSSVKNKRTKEIEKCTFYSSVNESVCALSNNQLQEPIEDMTEKYAHNVNLIENNERLAPNNQLIDVLSGNGRTRNELELNVCNAAQLIPGNCSTVTRIQTQSPDIFASSEDESDEAVNITTLGAHHYELYTNIKGNCKTTVFKNIENPVISHGSELTDTNVSFIEDRKIEKHQQSETRINNAVTYNRSINTRQTNTSEEMDSIHNNESQNYFEDCLMSSDKEINYLTRKNDIVMFKELRNETSQPNQTPSNSSISMTDVNFFKNLTQENKEIFSNKASSSRTLSCRKTFPHAGIQERETEFEVLNYLQPEERDSSFDDCLVLSDDEINYSIRKADMRKRKTSLNNCEEKLEISFTGNMNEFPMLDLMESKSSLENNFYESVDFNISSHTSEKVEEVPKVSRASRTDRSIQLLEFGILDNLSESLTQTPPISKIPNNKLSESSISLQNAPVGFDKLITCNIRFGCHQDRVNGIEMNSPTLQTLQLSEFFPHEYEIDGRIYMARLVTEPKLGLKHQTEAEILKQLYGFGIKPLKRKQAVKLLGYIYNSTHPFIRSTSLIDHEFDTTQSSGATPSLNELQLVDVSSTEIMGFTKELKTDLENEDYVFQTNVTKKTFRPLLPLHIAWYNLVYENSGLYEQILMYEPIDLHEVYVFFKKLGYRFEPKDMKVFLDNRSIIFRYDMTHPDRQHERHIRKKKRKATLMQIL